MVYFQPELLYSMKGFSESEGGTTGTLALNADKTFTLQHTYADDGVYTVEVTVVDSQGRAAAGVAVERRGPESTRSFRRNVETDAEGMARFDFSVRQESGGFILCFPYSGGESMRKGMRPGDSLESFDGISASKLSLQELFIAVSHQIIGCTYGTMISAPGLGGTKDLKV